MLITTMLQNLNSASAKTYMHTSPDVFKQNSQQKIYERLQTFDEKTQIALQTSEMPSIHPPIFSSQVTYKH